MHTSLHTLFVNTASTASGAAAPVAPAASLPPSTVGAIVLMLMLGTGIVVGIRSKKLTYTELTVCGGFGLLMGTTSLGAALSGPLGSLGGFLLQALAR